MFSQDVYTKRTLSHLNIISKLVQNLHERLLVLENQNIQNENLETILSSMENECERILFFLDTIRGKDEIKKTRKMMIVNIHQETLHRIVFLRQKNII